MQFSHPVSYHLPLLFPLSLCYRPEAAIFSVIRFRCNDSFNIPCPFCFGESYQQELHMDVNRILFFKLFLTGTTKCKDPGLCAVLLALFSAAQKDYGQRREHFSCGSRLLFVRIENLNELSVLIYVSVRNVIKESEMPISERSIIT